jgi:hypothetical protein
MKAILLCAVALTIVTVVACAKRPDASEEIVVGGFYASKSEDGTYTDSILK